MNNYYDNVAKMRIDSVIAAKMKTTATQEVHNVGVILLYEQLNS